MAGKQCRDVFEMMLVAYEEGRGCGRQGLLSQELLLPWCPRPVRHGAMSPLPRALSSSGHAERRTPRLGVSALSLQKPFIRPGARSTCSRAGWGSEPRAYLLLFICKCCLLPQSMPEIRCLHTRCDPTPGTPRRDHSHELQCCTSTARAHQYQVSQSATARQSSCSRRTCIYGHVAIEQREVGDPECDSLAKREQSLFLFIT